MLAILVYALIVIGLFIAVAAALWGLIHTVLIIVFFFKALYDRLTSEEDEYYSKSIDK
jgi:hypothetical protein